MNYHDCVGFLHERGAHLISHSCSTLLDHLKGTHALLQEWGNDEDTCNAGLFHSVYGTHNFSTVLIQDRDQLRNLIGEKAEHLVWLLSTIDEHNIEVGEDTARRLTEIQIADMAEQNSRWDNYREQHKWVRTIEHQDVSEGARLAYESLSL